MFDESFVLLYFLSFWKDFIVIFLKDFKFDGDLLIFLIVLFVSFLNEELYIFWWVLDILFEYIII